MTTLREAAQQALEALEALDAPPSGVVDHYELDRRKQALRDALAQQEQEPVTQMRGNALARWAHEQEEPPDTGWQRDWQRGYETARRWVRQVGLPSLAQQEAPKGGGKLPPPLQAEPVQEPVAYSVQSPDDAKRNRITPSLVTDTRLELEEYLGNSETAKHIVPLFTAPPRREWRGLSEQERHRLWRKLGEGEGIDEYAEAIEQALKEKNND